VAIHERSSGSDGIIVDGEEVHVTGIAVASLRRREASPQRQPPLRGNPGAAAKSAKSLE
jgi:hypothetical protein